MCSLLALKCCLVNYAEITWSQNQVPQNKTSLDQSLARYFLITMSKTAVIELWLDQIKFSSIGN